MVLGYHDEIRSSFVDYVFSRFATNELEVLKAHEAPLNVTIEKVLKQSVTSLTSLRVIDLGYISLKTSALNELVAFCAGTLEELHLSWIMQADPEPLFTDYAGQPLQRLKAFTSKGPQVFHDEHIRCALGDAPALTELHARNLTAVSAFRWVPILGYLSETRTSNTLKRLKLGALTNSSAKPFWIAVARLLRSCGGQLEVLHINGSPKGLAEPMPPDLWSAISNCASSNLSQLVLMWRADQTMTIEQTQILCDITPSLTFLHICMNITVAALNDLPSLFRFPKLVRLHLTFYDGDVGAEWFTDEVTRELIFRRFVHQICLSCPALKEVSWSVYGIGGLDPQKPSLYVEVNSLLPHAHHH